MLLSIAMVSTIFVRTFFAPTISGKPGKKTVSGIRDIDFVRSVREDPVRKGCSTPQPRKACTFRWTRAIIGAPCD